MERLSHSGSEVLILDGALGGHKHVQDGPGEGPYMGK